MKKAQIQLQFNWIFVIIAGAVILLFFFGLVYKQRAVSEERLQGDVTRIIEDIFVGAGVSEKTKNLVDIPSQYEFYFKCNDVENIREFGITDSEARAELPNEPLFSPGKIHASKLVTWSLPVQLPYKIADILLVTAPNIKYVIIGDESLPFVQELMKDVNEQPEDNRAAPSRIHEGLNFEFVNSPDDVNTRGNNRHVRLVYLEDAPGEVPAALVEEEDDKISAVWLQPGVTRYYKNSGGQFESFHEFLNYQISEGRNALTIASMVAEDAFMYQCNLRKVFQRMEYVNQLYEEKMNDIITYYDNEGEEVCKLKSQAVLEVLLQLRRHVQVCLSGGDCTGIVEQAAKLQQENYHPQTGLSTICPITLY